MKKWSSYADDLIFAGIDLGGGFKSPEQVGLDLAKTAVTAVISMGCSSAGSAVGKVADASLKGAGKVLAKAGISAATSYVTTVGNSFVNNWNLDANGNLAFDSESFGKSTYSAQTIAGSVGAGVTAGLTTAANMKMQKMGDNGAAVNKFYGTAVNAGISAAGKLSEYAVYSAYALAEGRSLKDAYDDMGGLTFNFGSLGMFADMMASGIARNNATGQAGKFGEIAQKLEGKGILEINIGSNGIKGKFGMGGFDLAGSLYTFGKRMSDKASLKAYAMQEGVSKDEAEAAYLGYVYGDWTQENTMARISSRRDELHIVDKMADGANAQTVQKADGSGRIITMKNTGDYHTNAVTLGHESYRDGIVSNKADQQRETFNAVLGHTGMAERMTQYGNSFSGLLAAEIEAYQRGDMNALMMDSLYNYDSSADYWKLMDDGSIAYDGRADLYDENDNLIYQTKKRGLEGSFIEILYGENATAEQKKAAIDLLEKNFSHYTKGGDKDNRDNWYWDTKDNEGKSMSVDQYEDIYKTRVLKDSVTGVEATIEQHNPVNIYKKMVANGTMDLRPGIENAPEDFVKAMGNGKYITYDQFKKNNYITGGIPDYTINTPVPDGSVISTLFGAGGTSAAGSYRIHAGIDFAVVSGTKVYPMLVNDDTFVIAAHNEDSYKDTIQGKYVLLGSNFSYNYKGVNIDELITQSYDHLTSTTLKVDDTINANTLLGLSGNTGKWGTKTYGAHLHTDIYTNLKSSPLLNYINMNYKNNIAKNLMHQSSLNNSPSRYYDPLALLQNYTYKIRQDAWTY